MQFLHIRSEWHPCESSKARRVRRVEVKSLKSSSNVLCLVLIASQSRESPVSDEILSFHHSAKYAYLLSNTEPQPRPVIFLYLYKFHSLAPPFVKRARMIITVKMDASSYRWARRTEVSMYPTPLATFIFSRLPIRYSASSAGKRPL